MQILHTSEARKNLHKLVDQVSDIQEPTYIKGKRNIAVLVSLEEWENMQETSYINSVPGLAESIKEAADSPDEDFISIEELAKQVPWLNDRKKNV